jgi:hypothetical protein
MSKNIGLILYFIVAGAFFLLFFKLVVIVIRSLGVDFPDPLQWSSLEDCPASWSALYASIESRPDGAPGVIPAHLLAASIEVADASSAMHPGGNVSAVNPV